MTLTPTVKTILETAPAKAFATAGDDGVNVVPVSMVRVNEKTIWLFDFFMHKTTANLTSNAQCALTAWEGMKGVQLKGTATYHTDGAILTEAIEWVHTQNPDRVVRGVVEITPTKVFDISPGGAYSAAELGMGEG